MEDVEIVGLYWARDQLAIAESQQKYGSLCGGIAMNILHNREDSEECVNDTWGRAWESMPPQRPERLGAYLGKIVRNLSLNRWRMRRAEKRGGGEAEVLLSELGECLPEPGGGLLCEEEQLSSVIARWLEGLPEEDRVLFLRRYWYGDSLESIARAQGTGANYLAVRMHRLRRRLRSHLEREGVAV